MHTTFHLAAPQPFIWTRTDLQEIPTSFLHFRDKDNAEVDIVLEQGARAVAAIEVKASSTVTASDLFAVPICALWEPGGRAR
jgi:hypothetical protein